MKLHQRTPRARLSALLLTAVVGTGCASSGGGSEADRPLDRKSMGPAVTTVGILDSRSPAGRSQQSFTAGISVAPPARLVELLVQRSGPKTPVRFVDARGLGLKPGDLAAKTEATTAALSKVPADAFGGLRLLGCSSELRSETVTRSTGTGSVQVTVYWYEGSCPVELTVVDADGTTMTTLEVTGRQESSRNEQREGASVQEQVFWGAVDDAAKRLLDRVARKHLHLPVPFDLEAPLANEGLAHLDAGRLTEARTLWEGALSANPSSAGLRFNLGAVCEALGDAAAAKTAYEGALSLSPDLAKAKKALARLAAAQRPPA